MLTFMFSVHFLEIKHVEFDPISKYILLIYGETGHK